MRMGPLSPVVLDTVPTLWRLMFASRPGAPARLSRSRESGRRIADSTLAINANKDESLVGDMASTARVAVVSNSGMNQVLPVDCEMANRPFDDLENAG